LWPGGEGRLRESQHIKPIGGWQIAKMEGQIEADQDVAGMLSVRISQPGDAGWAVSAENQGIAHMLQALDRQRGNVGGGGKFS
jgi:hypothetical protein